MICIRLYREIKTIIALTEQERKKEKEKSNLPSTSMVNSNQRYTWKVTPIGSFIKGLLITFANEGELRLRRCHKKKRRSMYNDLFIQLKEYIELVNLNVKEELFVENFHLHGNRVNLAASSN